MHILNVFTIILGSIFVLFVPGYALSFVFMKQKSVDVLERIALSFALSISVVPLVAFYLNMLGVRITALSIVVEVVCITALACVYVRYTHKYHEK